KMVEPGVGSDPDVAIGAFMDDANDIARQRARVVAFMAECTHAVAVGIDQVEAVGRACPDPPRAILMEEKHQVVGQARRIVFAMLPGTPFTAVRIEADHADMATGRPDRTVTADDEHAPSRIDASALGSRLGRNLAGFRLDRG